jgi:uncharacterized membrane protein
MTLGQQILAARDRAELLANPTRHREVMVVMTGAGRLSGRGVSVAATALPARVPTHHLILPFRLATVLAAQLFDFGTFTVMIARHGIISEMNPLVAQGFTYFGMPVLVLMKAALVVLLASTIIVLDRNRSARKPVPAATFVTVLGVVGGLVGGISNVIAS